jgi:uncharacterized protein (DUF433 family)
VSLWSTKGIVVPTSKWIDEDDKETQGYSFEGLVYLRLVRLLRTQDFPMRAVVDAVNHLKDVFGPPGPRWEDARIFAEGRDIWVDHKDTWGVTSASRGGQKASQVLLGSEFALLKERADALLVPSHFARHVEVDPGIRNGLPVVRETTIQTATIHHLHGTGLTYKRIGEYYPHLSRTQIVRANRFEQFLDSDSIAA